MKRINKKSKQQNGDRIGMERHLLTIKDGQDKVEQELKSNAIYRLFKKARFLRKIF